MINQESSSNSGGQESKEVVALPVDLGSALSYLPGIEGLPSFQNLLDWYQGGYLPKRFTQDAAVGVGDVNAFISSIAVNLIHHLCELQSRWGAHHAGIHVGVEWDRKWTQAKQEWESKRDELIRLLNGAADLFESGQSVTPFGSTLAKYKLRDQSSGQGDVDQVSWCGGENLRRWTKILGQSPVETVFPVAQPYPAGWHVGEFGNRGQAIKPDGALRGMTIRAIAEYIPDEMMEINGYSVISELSAFIGADGVSRQHVRGVLLKGRT